MALFGGMPATPAETDGRNEGGEDETEREGISRRKEGRGKEETELEGRKEGRKKGLVKEGRTERRKEEKKEK